jgi:hypothetical protein
VRLVELRLATRAADREMISRDLNDLETLLHGAVRRPQRLLAPLWAAWESGEWRDLERELDRLEGNLERELDPEPLSFGKWAEAGRQAAIAEDATLFRAPAFTRFAEGRFEEDPAFRELRGELRAVREGEADWESLRREFTDLVGAARPRGVP